MFDLDSFINYLKKNKIKGANQSTIGVSIGKDQAYISMIKKGLRPFNKEYVDMLRKAYGDDIIDGFISESKKKTSGIEISIKGSGNKLREIYSGNNITRSGDNIIREPEKNYEKQSGTAKLIENPNIKYIPMVSQYAYAGYLNGYADEEYIDTLPVVPIIVDHEIKGNYLVFEVKGDSMNDGTEESILEGDRAICREVNRDFWRGKLHINKWDFVIVHRTDGVLIKRIIKHDVEKGEIVIHSLNPDYPDRILHLNDVAQIFNVIEVHRNRKR